MRRVWMEWDGWISSPRSRAALLPRLQLLEVRQEVPKEVPKDVPKEARRDVSQGVPKEGQHDKSQCNGPWRHSWLVHCMIVPPPSRRVLSGAAEQIMGGKRPVLRYILDILGETRTCIA